MPIAGIAAATGFVPIFDEEQIRRNVGTGNERLLAKLKQDVWEEELHKLTLEDARLGRMTWPVDAELSKLASQHVCPRPVALFLALILAYHF